MADRSSFIRCRSPQRRAWRRCFCRSRDHRSARRRSSAGPGTLGTTPTQVKFAARQRETLGQTRCRGCRRIEAESPPAILVAKVRVCGMLACGGGRETKQPPWIGTPVGQAAFGQPFEDADTRWHSARTRPTNRQHDAFGFHRRLDGGRASRHHGCEFKHMPESNATLLQNYHRDSMRTRPVPDRHAARPTMTWPPARNRAFCLRRKTLSPPSRSRT